METRKCVVCGRDITRKYKAWFRNPPEKTVCLKCRNTFIAKTRKKRDMSREKNPFWNGGVMHSWGYVYLLKPEHPRANRNGYMKRATLVLEEKLGRRLQDGEFAHHNNGDRGDDRPDNLEPMFRNEHQRMHALGNQHWRKRCIRN